MTTAKEYRAFPSIAERIAHPGPWESPKSNRKMSFTLDGQLWSWGDPKRAERHRFPFDYKCTFLSWTWRPMGATWKSIDKAVQDAQASP